MSSNKRDRARGLINKVISNGSGLEGKARDWGRTWRATHTRHTKADLCISKQVLVHVSIKVDLEGVRLRVAIKIDGAVRENAAQVPIGDHGDVVESLARDASRGGRSGHVRLSRLIVPLGELNFEISGGRNGMDCLEVDSQV